MKKAATGKRVFGVYDLMIIIFAAVFLFSGYKVISAIAGYREAQQEYADIANGAVKDPELNNRFIEVDGAALTAKNSDYIGWLRIPDTAVNYPCVWADDYSEYLRTTFDKTHNQSGSIFEDFNCERGFTGRVTILYGHHMGDGSMFGGLHQYLEQSYFDDHSEIQVYVGDKVYVYRAFAAFEPTGGDYTYTASFSSDSEYESWIGRIMDMAIASGEAPGANDSVLLLSTCKKGSETVRTVVAAVLTGIISPKL